MTSNGSSSSNRRGHGSSHSQPQIDVIDLTGSPPQSAPAIPAGPRSRPSLSNRLLPPPTREVIDLDSLPDLPPPLPPRPHFRQEYRPQHDRRHVPHLPSEDITRNNHDVVMLGDSPPTQQRGLPSFFNIFRSSILSTSAAAEQVTHFHYHIHQPSPAPPFRPPGRLNYAMNAAHVYGDDATPLRDLPGFKDDNYRAPPPARTGFTRSPTENMTLICPQCNDELGKSKEDPKKEVWIGKCGHTYCGECAASHRRNRSRGAKAGRCIVDGCNKIISGDKGMIKVIL